MNNLTAKRAVLDVLEEVPEGLCDASIRKATGLPSHQQVNSTCRSLEREGKLNRAKGICPECGKTNFLNRLVPSPAQTIGNGKGQLPHPDVNVDAEVLDGCRRECIQLLNRLDPSSQQEPFSKRVITCRNEGKLSPTKAALILTLAAYRNYLTYDVSGSLSDGKDKISDGEKRILIEIDRELRTFMRLALVLAIAFSIVASGCSSKSSASPASSDARQIIPKATTPPRPTVAPATFKVFHKSDTTYTLVVPEDATDEQVESLIWELRDAAHARTLDRLKLSQKMVDERKPIVWFHIYRGAKCASEKYADGPPPCGGSYHAAGDFTYGGYKNKDADSGVILHGEDHETQLWDPEAASVSKGSGS